MSASSRCRLSGTSDSNQTRQSSSPLQPSRWEYYDTPTDCPPSSTTPQWSDVRLTVGDVEADEGDTSEITLRDDGSTEPSLWAWRDNTQGQQSPVDTADRRTPTALRVDGHGVQGPADSHAKVTLKEDGKL